MTPTAEQRWLDAAAEPGRASLRFAGAFVALETVFVIGQWAALAWIGQDLINHGRQPTWPALSLLLACGLLAAVAAWIAARLRAAGRQRISTALRRRLVTALLPSRVRRADPDAATVAMATIELSDDIGDYHAAAQPQRVSTPASMATVFVVTAVVQWPAAVLLLICTLAIPLNMRLAGLFAKQGADERVAASARLGAVVLDSFRGMRTLQAIGAIARRRDELAPASAELETTTMATVRRAFLSGSVMDVVITFSIAVNATYIGLSLLGYVHIGVAPAMTLSRGLLVLLLCPMYFEPMRTMAAAYHSRERALAAVPTISALLAEPEGVPDMHRGAAPAPATGPLAVVLDAVAFRFPGSTRCVLHDVNLTVSPGSWIAVTGPSGSGKTTLLSLIGGLRQPTAGTVRWDTADGLSTRPHLGGCAWIGQQTVVLPGSIADNVRVGRPAATRADVERAVAAAGLSNVVARLSQGLDTPVGEGGWGLSTGEARRIAIARAFLKDAELWVLDEPTAHLDHQAEARVLDALRTATDGRTVVVATHSAAVAGAAETVVSLADGTIQRVREAVLT